MFNFFKQWKLIFKTSVNRNGKKLTVSRKKAKNLTGNRKSHHPIETLKYGSARPPEKVISDSVSI